MATLEVGIAEVTQTWDRFLVRRLSVLVVFAGCSFTPGSLPQSSPQDAPADIPDDINACAGPDGDGDGVNDPCDPCPDDIADDSDDDGVCDSVDMCSGGPDDADADADTIADACDDWPCGAKPQAPSATVMWDTANENVTLSAINVAASGQLAAVAASSALSVTASYSIVDCQCSGCIDQIEIGFHTIGKAACLYNGNPNGNGNCTTVTTGTATRALTSPATPGVYELRFNRGNDTSCQTNGAWWANVAPGAGNTFALVCVQ